MHCTPCPVPRRNVDRPRPPHQATQYLARVGSVLQSLADTHDGLHAAGYCIDAPKVIPTGSVEWFTAGGIEFAWSCFNREGAV